jgi:oxalate decarboxylase/phosphoglucose isomerase-like protein (cupin superfamily)
MEGKHSYKMEKRDLKNSVDAAIEKETKTMVGVRSKEEEFTYDIPDLADELRIDYDVTVLPPNQINGIYVCQDGPVFNYADIKSLGEEL